MELDRRAFTKLAVGAVLGVVASPMMPKFTDDAAIWTQNWSWVPVPAEGELAFANSVNPATGTGLKARIITSRTEGRRLIRVEGNPEHPISQGGALPADVSALQLMYYGGIRASEAVLRDPVTSAKGRVKAEKALAVLTARLKKLIEGGKAGQILIYAADSDNTTGDLLKALAQATGMKICFAPNAKDTLALAGELMLGNSRIGFDLANADYVLSIGTPLFEGYGDPVAVRKVLAGWRGDEGSGGQFAQVEPRASVSASQADAWLACKPGTEGAVAMGIAGLLIKSGAKTDAGGFKDFAALCESQYSPEQVEKISGLKPAKLKEAADAFAKAKKPLAVCGPDDAGGPGRLYDFMAVLALNMLKGNLGKEGGVVARQPLPVKAFAKDNGPAPGGENIYSAAKSVVKGESKISAVICVGTNPVYAGPDAALMEKFLAKVPFLASIGSFKDETFDESDVFLPAASFLECWGDCGTGYASPVSYYGVHKPLIKAEGASKAAGDWILSLAKGLGGKAAEALNFESMEAALGARLKEMGELAELAESGCWAQEAPEYKDISGDAQLVSTALADAVKKAGGPEKAGLALKDAAAMPHYEPPAALAGVDKEHPLLMAAIPSLRTTCGRQPMSPLMMKILYDTTLAHNDQLMVEMNPQTAKELHLAPGEAVTISSKTGHISAHVHLFNGAAPGMVYVPVGLGHTSFGEYLKDKGDNFQRAAVASADPVSGAPQWNLTAVRVEKAKGMAHV